MLDKVSNILTGIFGTKSERDLKVIWPIVDEVNGYYEKMEQLSDEELKQKTDSFRQKINDAVSEIDAEIASAKEILNSTEELSMDRRRERAEQLDDLRQQKTDSIEEVLDEILPEAYAVMKDTCRRFVGKKWKVGGSMTEWN